MRTPEAEMIGALIPDDPKNFEIRWGMKLTSSSKNCFLDEGFVYFVHNKYSDQ